MAESEVVEPVPPGPEIENLNISPELRANLVITLINEIEVIGADDDQHDLNLFFLGFSQQVLASLQRLSHPHSR